MGAIPVAGLVHGGGLSRAWCARLQPDGVPEWVITCARGQAGADGIGDDVAGRCLEVIVLSQRVIVECPAPQCTVAPAGAVGGARAGRFQSFHDGFKRIAFTQLQQPMCVIRHQHPGQQARVTQVLRSFEASRRSTGGIKITKDGLAALGACGQMVNMVRQ